MEAENQEEIVIIGCNGIRQSKGSFSLLADHFFLCIFESKNEFCPIDFASSDSRLSLMSGMKREIAVLVLSILYVIIYCPLSGSVWFRRPECSVVRNLVNGVALKRVDTATSRESVDFFGFRQSLFIISLLSISVRSLPPAVTTSSYFRTPNRTLSTG